MSLLGRLRATLRGDPTSVPRPDSARPVKGVDVACLALHSGGLVSVVGESFYQDAIVASRAHCQSAPPVPVVDFAAEVHAEEELPWFTAVLIREPENEYDPEAIAVWSQLGKIGHLSREDARRYQPVLLTIEGMGSQAGACSAFMRQADNGMWGVVLALSAPGECLSDLEDEDEDQDYDRSIAIACHANAPISRHETSSLRFPGATVTDLTRRDP
jgi:hypothetical protein